MGICSCEQWQKVEMCSVEEGEMDRGEWNRRASQNNYACGTELFAPRFGHAVTTFKDQLWIAGGKTDNYQRWDLRYSTRQADVWKSHDGKSWAQVKTLNGEYSEQNADAKFPGRIAPWWERFGHSLDTMDYTRLAPDGILERQDNYSAMVLAGGYAPDPKNDVWVSEDGAYWRRVYACPSVLEVHISCKPAPWSPRAWHATTIFHDELWVLGGSPLNNEVWAGSNLTKGKVEGETVWNMLWTRYGNDDSVAWSPRSGLAVASQVQRIIVGDGSPWVEKGGREVRLGADTGNGTVLTEYLYVFGGFAGWPEDDARWDGERARNDVYRTQDGYNWTRLDNGGAPWGARAYHSVVTWNANRSAPFVDVTQAAYKDSTELYQTQKGFQTQTKDFEYVYNDHPEGRMEQLNDDIRKERDVFTTIIPRFKREEQRMAPRMWLSGGSYSGEGGGHQHMEGKPNRPDMGNNFVREMDGYVDLWWSRNGIDWYSVTKQEGEKETLYSSSQCFKTRVETEDYYLAKWAHKVVAFKPKSSMISALYFVAGDTVKTMTSEGEELGGSHVSDVFMSSNGILCDINGRTCSDRGICAPTHSRGDLYALEAMVVSAQDQLWREVHPDYDDLNEKGKADARSEALSPSTWSSEEHASIDSNYTYGDVTGLYAFYPRTNKKRDVTSSMYQGCLCFGGFVGEYCEGEDPTLPSGARSFLAAASWLTAVLVLVSTVALEW